MRILLLALALLAAASARADTIVTAETIGGRIGEAIAVRLPTPGRYRVTLADPSYQLVLPAAAQNTYAIAALTFDPARHTFDATLSFTNQSGMTEYVRFGGNALPVIDVPALSRDIAMGETITEADLTSIEAPADRAASTMLTSAAGIVGQAARRPLRARTALFTHDLKKPVLIKKGELVTMIYSLQGIELTTQGQAQSDAGLGDSVSILNTRSRRAVEGRVTAAGTVSVGAPNLIAAK